MGAKLNKQCINVTIFFLLYFGPFGYSYTVSFYHLLVAAHFIIVIIVCLCDNSREHNALWCLVVGAITKTGRKISVENSDEFNTPATN